EFRRVLFRSNAIAFAVLDALLPALELFDREGLAPFEPRFAALDVLAGQPVRVLDGRGDFEGRALGLAPDGALRVATDAGERRVHAGGGSVRRRRAAGCSTWATRASRRRPGMAARPGRSRPGRTARTCIAPRFRAGAAPGSRAWPARP